MLEKIRNMILDIKYKRHCPKCNSKMHVTFANDYYVTLECPGCKSFLQIKK